MLHTHPHKHKNTYMHLFHGYEAKDITIFFPYLFKQSHFLYNIPKIVSEWIKSSVHIILAAETYLPKY